MTKVLFVEPHGSDFNVYTTFMKIPLLGPVYLATIAKDKGYDASVLNENIVERDVTNEELASTDILALSCLTTTIERGKTIAKQYKKLRQSKNLESRTLVGGIHASMLPKDVKNDFDQVFMGECDPPTLLQILAGENTNKFIHGNPLQNLDALPFPNFTLIKDYEKMHSIPVMTSLGCPYDCEYCSVVEMFGKIPRRRSNKNILDELSRYNEGNIFFIDDNFTAQPKKLKKFLDELKASDFSQPWSAQTRVEITKQPELVKKMKEAGCFMGYFGFEGVTDAALKALNKKQTVADIERSIRVFHENNIQVLGMFMAGMEPDTQQTFQDITDFVEKTQPDFFQLSALSPLPGTELCTRYQQEGRILHEDWEYYDGLHVVSQPPPNSNLTPFELQEGIISCYKQFYSYTNGIKTFFRTLFDRNKNTPFPYHPAAMRFLGKGIIKNWSKHNEDYMERLKHDYN